MPIPYNGGEFVLSKGRINYQAVLDDFSNAKQVRVLTYNISKKNYKNELIDALKSLSEDVDVQIISNIPSRMPNYYNTPAGAAYREKYRSSYSVYLDRLNPEHFPSNPQVAFNFDNHAKIIGTDNIVYIGSANYSDESKDNFESGTLIRDKDFIHQLYIDVFPAILDDSTPYFDDNYNVLRLFVISMEQKFRKWLEKFDDELIFTNPNTGHRSIVDYFRFDVNDLQELDSDVDELRDFVGVLEDTYSEEDDKYNGLIEELENSILGIGLDWIADFTITDSPFYEFLVFDEEDLANEYISEDPDAYDENLEACVEAAMSRVSDEYSSMRYDIEDDVIRLRDEISRIVDILKRTHEETLKFFNKWVAHKVDNT